MTTECTAATTGFCEFSTARMTDSRIGSRMALVMSLNSRMSAPPENALPAPVSTMALTAGSLLAFSRALVMPTRVS